MVRFRRRVEPLSLEVRTVRSRGYLLQARVDIPTDAEQAMDVGAVLLDILVVLVAAKVAAEIAERINVPAVVAEIVAGIIVGPVGARLRGRQRDAATCSPSSA